MPRRLLSPPDTRAALVGLATTLTCLSLTEVASADIIDDLQPGQWVTIPNSKMSAVQPDPVPPGYSEAVVSAWSGAAYDTTRERLLLWGGGHSDYSGNEVYAFSLSTFTWARIVDPSTDVPEGENFETYPDGKPSSRHTYSGLAYVPAPIDALFALGGSRWQQGGGTSATWRLDLGTLGWARQADYPGSVNFGSPTVFDPVTGHLFHRGLTILGEYDPQTDTWEEAYEDQGGWYEANVSTALDPTRRLMVILGDKTFYAFHVDNRTYESPATTGGDAIIQAGAPGFDFDPMAGVFVAWAGGADVYTLDPTTWQWLVHPTTGTPPGDPQPSGGTFGRFRYVPSRNVYVLVNGYDEDVYLFRLSPGDGVSPTTASTSSSGTGAGATAASGGTGTTGAGGAGGADATEGGDACDCRVGGPTPSRSRWLGSVAALVGLVLRRRARLGRRRG